eukprot:567453-Hanusia_phi.AAC.1
MFRDDDGRVCNIEVRGERSINKCFFKASDVAKELQMDNLKTTIQHKEYGYEQGIADRFQRWAAKTLFTIQMGTVEEKKELCANMLGINIDVARQ